MDESDWGYGRRCLCEDEMTESAFHLLNELPLALPIQRYCDSYSIHVWLWVLLLRSLVGLVWASSDYSIRVIWITFDYSAGCFWDSAVFFIHFRYCSIPHVDAELRLWSDR